MKSFISALAISSAMLFAAKNEDTENAKRLKVSQEVLQEAMNAGDQSIPRDLIERAHCVAVVPGMKQAGFILGGKYGKGYLMCRKEGGGWQGPAAVRIEGGSFGLQIGGGETDLILLVMNKAGRDRILRNEFKMGGSAAVMAGPLGKNVQAETDLYMRAEMLGYSRSRGVFAGLALNGSTMREDLDDNHALYGSKLSNTQILDREEVKTPEMGQGLLRQLSAISTWEKK
jgi:lipid-binding SYLF domain-containing protein